MDPRNAAEGAYGAQYPSLCQPQYRTAITNTFCSPGDQPSSVRYVPLPSDTTVGTIHGHHPRQPYLATPPTQPTFRPPPLVAEQAMGGSNAVLLQHYPNLQAAAPSSRQPSMFVPQQHELHHQHVTPSSSYHRDQPHLHPTSTPYHTLAHHAQHPMCLPGNRSPYPQGHPANSGNSAANAGSGVQFILLPAMVTPALSSTSSSMDPPGASSSFHHLHSLGSMTLDSSQMLLNSSNSQQIMWRSSTSSCLQQHTAPPAPSHIPHNTEGGGHVQLPVMVRPLDSTFAPSGPSRSASTALPSHQGWSASCNIPYQCPSASASVQWSNDPHRSFTNVSSLHSSHGAPPPSVCAAAQDRGNHPAERLKPAIDGGIVCRHFLEGKCNRRKCRFLHQPIVDGACDASKGHAEGVHII